jgi:enhancing lycopene biosynthesis protein 2
MSKNIAVVLSGCGHLDGSEIHEAILTLLAISKSGATYQGLAPNRNQSHVVNHVTQEVDESSQSRNIMLESARLVRGDIIAIDQANIKNYDAVIFPGGFGAAKNLFDFAVKGDASFTVQQDVIDFVDKAKEAGKPMGFICVSPVMMPKLFNKVKMTIGTDEGVIGIVESLGAKHHMKNVDEICIDEKNKLVSTPAYMLGENIYDVSKGIDKLVNEVLKMCD